MEETTCLRSDHWEMGSESLAAIPVFSYQVQCLGDCLSPCGVFWWPRSRVGVIAAKVRLVLSSSTQSQSWVWWQNRKQGGLGYRSPALETRGQV